MTIYRDELARAQQRAGVSWIDPMSVADAAETARKHPDLLAAMKIFWSFNDYHRVNLGPLRASAVELKSAIESEAGE